MSAEENSPVDCFCRRGQGAKRREGARECAEKNPLLSAKTKSRSQGQLFALAKINKGIRTRGGADLSAEENSPVDCF